MANMYRKPRWYVLLPPVEPINFTQLADYSQAFFNGGSGLVGNELHGMFLDTSMSSLGIILLKHFASTLQTGR